jgi:hypothetical protein
MKGENYCKNDKFNDDSRSELMEIYNLLFENLPIKFKNNCKKDISNIKGEIILLFQKYLDIIKHFENKIYKLSEEIIVESVNNNNYLIVSYLCFNYCFYLVHYNFYD